MTFALCSLTFALPFAHADEVETSTLMPVAVSTPAAVAVSTSLPVQVVTPVPARTSTPMPIAASTPAWITVVHPLEGAKLPAIREVFVYGAVVAGSTLTINGSTVPVHAKGGWLVMVPLVPGRHFAELGRQSARRANGAPGPPILGCSRICDVPVDTNHSCEGFDRAGGRSDFIGRRSSARVFPRIAAGKRGVFD